MPIPILVIVLIILFYLLGKSADLIVLRIKDIGEKFGVKIFFMGIILGFLTSLPELSIGMSSIAEGIPEISFGNLLGGIMVLFGIVLGLSAILNRKIKTDGKPEDITLITFYILLSGIIALDGSIGFFEGLLLVIIYLFLIYHLYKINKLRSKNLLIASRATSDKEQGTKKTIHTHELLKKIFIVFIGLVLILIVSNAIVKITHKILEELGVSAFAIGLILFSLGTNLPETIVTIRSWSRRIKDLSISNIVGSAMANAFIVGLLATTKTIPVTVNASYIALIFFMLAILGITIRFYETEKSFSRKEGVLLAFTYGAFLLTQIALL